MKSLFACLIFICVVFTVTAQDRILYKLTKGTITFKSDAPLESITATSKRIKGLIDAKSRKFAFSIDMNSFKGFNNPLQKEHFFENFMEGSSFPTSTYSGKIIEEIDFDVNEKTTVRTKGMLNIHGVKRERIIKSELRIEGDKIYVKSLFTILLKEHNIQIPRIVFQKIAKEIFVTIDLVFEKS